MNTTYVRCGTLIDGTGTPPRSNVVLRLNGGQVGGIAPHDRADVPPGADVVDLSTFTVLPGLVECEDHLSVDFNGGVDPWGGSPAYLAIKGTHYARVLLRAGITTCRDLHEPYGIDVAWKQAIADGFMVGPRLLISCRPLTITGGLCHQIGAEVDGQPEIKRAIRMQLKQGADFIKVMQTGPVSHSDSSAGGTDQAGTLRPQFSHEELCLMAETAHQAGKPITAHAHGGASAQWLVEAGFDAIQHCTFFTREDLQRMAERGTILVATTGFMSPDPGSPEEELWACEADNFRRALESCHKVYGMAREEGVKVAVGTDTKHGAIAGEIRFLVDCGWTPMEAIMAATKIGGECCALSDVGTLETGKCADLIAVAGDPLNDLEALERVHLVMKDGIVQPVT